jgi:hypothetical protein
MNNHVEIVEKFKDEIWEHGRFSEGRGGIGGYGERFNFHNARYKMLTQEQRRFYESAVLELILDEDLEKAEVGVTMSEVLLEYKPPNWRKQVSSAFEAIWEHVLPIEEGDQRVFLAMGLLTAISSLGLKEFVPSLKIYTRQVTDAINKGELSLGTWEKLYSCAVRGLIRFSCPDAKEVLSKLLSQDVLLANLDERLDGLLVDIFFEGIYAHGFSCGKELVQIVFSSSNVNVAMRRKRALSSAIDALERWKYLDGEGEAEEYKNLVNKYLNA